jgi:hypothetical protein
MATHTNILIGQKVNDNFITVEDSTLVISDEADMKQKVPSIVSLLQLSGNNFCTANAAYAIMLESYLILGCTSLCLLAINEDEELAKRAVEEQFKGLIHSSRNLAMQMHRDTQSVLLAYAYKREDESIAVKVCVSIDKLTDFQYQDAPFSTAAELCWRNGKISVSKQLIDATDEATHSLSPKAFFMDYTEEELESMATINYIMRKREDFQEFISMSESEEPLTPYLN